MYEAPIRLLSGKKRNILDVGFGIGWGLDQMLKAEIVGGYIGFEPNADSFKYVRGRHGGNPKVELLHGPFRRGTPKTDHVFCIEVIEHVPMEGQTEFLNALRASTGTTLFLSTPDVRKHPGEGVRTCDEWQAMLQDAGFENVTVHREQWTVLFIAQ
jgi:hypothetical protein